jgi:hypothetical protein
MLRRRGERQAGMSDGMLIIHSCIAVEIDTENVENASEHVAAPHNREKSQRGARIHPAPASEYKLPI